MTLLSDPLSQEALDAVRSWMDLKSDTRTQFRGAAPARQNISNVLRFLGLPLAAERRNQDDSNRPLILRDEDRDHRWLYFRTNPIESGLMDGGKGTPLFGSQTNGVYHIFCLWEDARPDRIRQNIAIKNLARDRQSAVILLYFNALTDAERQDIRRHAWEDNLSFVILDEILLEYLVQRQRNAPYSLSSITRDFLAMTLPYTAANPYVLEYGARVAPEMFYGRQDLATSLATMRDGTSIVFGGRQLGKTALLRHLEESFSRPDEKHFAWFIDLKARGFVPTSSTGTARATSDILKIIHEQFCSEGILQSTYDDVSLDRARQEILDAFGNDQQLQLICMFDESDAFLELDSFAGSVGVESMRDLMNATNNRFKIVFAGLHNVQRYAGRPNNPFPNLGYSPNRPRRGGIGPLNDHEARQLVEQPSGLLGFRFEPLVVDRILSYTNRHPSLLQYFSHELIRTWREGHPDAFPPFVITINDVDRVFRSEGVQEGIRQRFEDTFKLDPRYHVIALTMIHFQERPTQKCSLNDIREFCQCYCSYTFDPENLDDLELRSLLNELIGLGILAEDGDHYRMRSSLISQMFGSNSEIERMLVELADLEPFVL